MSSLDTLKTRRRLKVGARSYDYFSIKAAEKAGAPAAKVAQLAELLQVAQREVPPLRVWPRT